MAAKDQKRVTIYTDGACSGNPGPGGWGAILIYKGIEKELSGFSQESTNNIMELTAIIEALKALKEKCIVDLYTDSTYCANAYLNGWIYNWSRNGWKKADKKEIANRELWQELFELTGYHTVNWNHVNGHADNELNNRCDKLATDEIKKNTKVDKTIPAEEQEVISK